MNETLEKQFEEAAKTSASPAMLNELILAAYDEGGTTGINLVVQLALSDFGGDTYKGEAQNICCLSVLHWELLGLRILSQEAIKKGGHRPISNLTSLLSHISSGTLSRHPYARFPIECLRRLDLDNTHFQSNDWTITARKLLIDLVSLAEEDEKFPASIVHRITHNADSDPAEHVFAALIARWFNFSENGLESYKKLIDCMGVSEIKLQNFLKSNPFILEPFHAQVWNKPRFGESLVPDFLIRSMDNHYTVVEIEKPDFPILTKAGELSSKAVHARRQALEFRSWAIDNMLYASQKYAGIFRPSCLVVIGIEQYLTDQQVSRLRQENESTQGILRIVGFDWLYLNARATFDNLLNFGFNKRNFRAAISDNAPSIES